MTCKAKWPQKEGSEKHVLKNKAKMKLNFSKHVTVKHKDMFGCGKNRKDEK